MSTSRWGIAAAVAAGIFLTIPNPTQAQALTDFSKFYQDAPSGYVSVGVLTMWRDRPSTGATVAGNPGGTPSFRSGRDFDFNTTTGVDATIGLRFWRTEAIEVRFMNFDTTAHDAFTTPGAFIGAGFTGPAGTLFEGSARTKLQSWEVNWRHQVFDQLSVLAGVRSFSLFDMMFYRLNNNVATGRYTYNNKLLGGQIGAEWAILPISSPFMINVFGKIGYYNLQASGGIDEFQGNNFIGQFFGRGHDWVYASEAGVTVGYRISNNVLIRATYQGLWLNDIALAANAASVSLLNPSLLRSVHSSDLFLQGVTFGMTISY
jgi:hypothetical protein